MLFGVLKNILKENYYRAKVTQNRNHIFHLVSLDLQLSYISFREGIYQQKRGLPQGGVTSPLYATIVVDHNLKKIMHRLRVQYGVRFVRKYVDDFLFYLPADKIDGLKNCLRENMCLDFTVEREEVNDLGVPFISYLDLIIYRDVQKRKFLFSHYKKPQASNRSIHQLSSHSELTKANTCNAMLEKILLRTSTVYLEKDLNYIMGVWQENGYGKDISKKWLGIGVSKYIHGNNPNPNRICVLQNFCMIKGATIRRRRSFFSIKKGKKWGGQKIVVEGYHNNVCDEVLRTILRNLGMGVPVYKYQRTLYRCLNMSLKTRKKNPKKWILAMCRKCTYCYFVGTTEEMEKCREHIRSTGHNVAYVSPYRFITNRISSEIRILGLLLASQGLRLVKRQIEGYWPVERDALRVLVNKNTQFDSFVRKHTMGHGYRRIYIVSNVRSKYYKFKKYNS